jgi:hypothetical protein
MTALSPIESPAHIDANRIRHLTNAALAEEFGLEGTTRPQHVRTAVRLDAGPGLWEVRERMRRLTVQERAALVAEAESLFDRVDVTGSTLGRSATYGWHYLGWIRPLARAWSATGERRFAERFVELFTEWDKRRDDVRGEWPSLDPIWYSLGIAVRGAVILEALELIEDLPDDVWARMVKVLIGGARWSFDEHDSYRTGNWQLACVARLYQVANAFPGAAGSPAWRERATERLLEHLDRDFTSDGGHSERSAGYHTFCLELLQTCAAIGVASGDASISGNPRLRLSHGWLGEMTVALGFTLPFQDTSVDWPGLAMLRGAALCSSPELLSLSESWLGADWSREVELLPPSLRVRLPQPVTPLGEKDSAAALRDSVHLDSSKYITLRCSEGAKGLSLTLNYGPRITHELESHSHFAALDFVLSDGTGELLWEAGTPDSYDDPHYHDWFRATRAHNVVVLGGRDIASDHRAVIDDLSLGGDIETISGHHDGYPVRVLRKLSLVRRDPAYLVVDDALGSHADDAALWLHAVQPWIAARHDGRAWWRTRDGRIAVTFVEEEVSSVTQEVGTARVARPELRTTSRQPLYSLVTAFGHRLRTVAVPATAGTLPSIVRMAGGFTVLWGSRSDDFHDER